MSDGRILVTGSRDWPSGDPRLPEAIGVAAAEFSAHRLRLVVVHGGCPSGADLYCHYWCVATPMYGRTPVIEEVHRAAWKTGKQAGPWRNRRMVDAGADVCLAFIKDNSPGASHCASYAEAAGIPVRYWRA